VRLLDTQGLPSEKIIEYNPDLKDTFAQKRLVTYGEKILRWVHYDATIGTNGTGRHAINDLVGKAMVRGRALSGYKDYFSKLYHAMGYDLGAAIMDMPDGMDRARRLIDARVDESYDFYKKTYRDYWHLGRQTRRI
jgi:hypothetical protein